MCATQKIYIAYLLRLWRADGAAGKEVFDAWRASLESPQTGERIGFGSAEELFAYLRQEMELCERKNAREQD
ncbi:MAG: hypothetical protein U0X20_10950 [Caldilineaceae bacterium]